MGKFQLEESVNPNSGGGGFAMPFGNVAPWYKSDAYELMGFNMYEAAKVLGLQPATHYSGEADERGTFDRLYYTPQQYAAAQEVGIKTGENGKKNYPQLVTQFACAKDTVLPEPLEFEPLYIVRKKSFVATGKEQYQLITLVSLVHAYAVNMGWTVTPIAFKEISNPKEFAGLDAEELGKLWEKYAVQRCTLWAELGESNHAADTFMGAHNVKGEEIKGKNVTVSPKLSEALEFAQQNWKQPIWAKIGVVADPARKGGRVPVVITVFDNEAQARAAVSGVDDKYADLYISATFAASMSKEEFAGALMTDLKPIYDAWQAATDAQKVIARKKFVNDLASYELTEEQALAWFAAL